MRRLVAAAAVLAVSCVTGLFAAQSHAADAPQFKKVRLTDTFLSEGATYADINKDGHTDVISGPYWYEGPDFAKKHEFMPVHKWDPAHEYSDAFLMFPGDFNHDGWQDILVVGFPTKEARWYENPKSQSSDSHWTEHPVVADHLDNESPLLTDLFKNGTQCLVSNVDGPFGYLSPDPADPNKPWVFHKISADNQHYGKFTHGLGVGDVNGDGRLDVVVHNGWWEQPEKVEENKPWPFHPFTFCQRAAQMLVYDVDADGKADVITSLDAHGYGIAWFKQLEGGKFERHLITNTATETGSTNLKFSQPHSMALADIDGDGVMDFVSGKRRFAHGDHGDVEPKADPVTYWFQLVRTPGQEPKFVPHLLDDHTGVGTQVIAADVNDDGKTDVLVGNKMGTTVFLQLAAAAGDAKPAAASEGTDHASRKVLVFSMTKGFHHASIPTGQKMMQELGESSKEFTAVVSDGLANFDPDKITQFSAIVFLNTTGEIPFTDEQKKAISDNVASGKIGFVGIHSATDTLYKWAEYGKMIGGHFDGHPWTADVTVTIRKEQENPTTASFPQEFPLTEEIYQMKEYDRAHCNVGLSLDTTKTDMTRKGIKRTDGDFPVSWVKTYGDKGRVFYTSMGHNDAVYQREDYQKHVLAGLKWVMGDFDMSTESHPLPEAKK